MINIYRKVLRFILSKLLAEMTEDALLSEVSETVFNIEYEEFGTAEVSAYARFSAMFKQNPLSVAKDPLFSAIRDAKTKNYYRLRNSLKRR